MFLPPKLTALLLPLFCIIQAYGQPERPTFRELDSIHRLHILHPENFQTQKPGFVLAAPVKASINNKATKAVVSGIKKQPLKTAALLTPASIQTTICFDTSARFFVINDTTSFYAGQPYQTSDGKVLIPGEAVVWHPLHTVSTGFLMKCDADGNVLWTKTYDSAGHQDYHYINYYRVLELKDGSLLLAGVANNNSTDNDDLILTHTDAAGNILWSKTYRSRFWTRGNGSGDYYYVQQMKQDPYENAVYLCGPLWSAGRTLMKLNLSDGTIVWSNSYETYANFDRAVGIDIRSDEIRYFGNTNFTYDYYVNVYRIDKANGKVMQVKNFKSNYPEKFQADFLKQEPLCVLNSGNYVLSGGCFGYWKWQWNGITPLQQAAVLELDSNLNFVRAYCFRNPVESNSYNTRVSVFPDNSGLFTMLKIYSGYNTDVYYVQFRDGQIIKQRKKHYVGEGVTFENNTLRLSEGGDLDIKLLSDSITNIAKIEFLKLHASDTASNCLGMDDFATFIEPFTYSEVQTVPIDSIATQAFSESTNQAITVQTTDAMRHPACFQISHCDSLKLLASDSVLCLSKALQLTVRKNIACGSLVPLTYDTTAVDTVMQLTDSTVSMHFKRAWSGFISGSLQGCTLMHDSVHVRVLNVPGRLNLGPDTAICPANTLMLNAHPGYATYQWQDGSTDSVFMVRSPGTYHVKATDACGGVFYDTVQVLAKPPTLISIGADRSKCNDDTVRLQAPAGFLNYTWSPVYNISNTTAQQVVVNPAVDTFYAVKAEKTPGCFAFDTVHITVWHAPAIQLGRDTAFCSGQSFTMDAGAGFVHYLWSTGDTTRRLTVKAKGVYGITATTSDGCRSLDTLEVRAVFSLPAPKLDKNTTLCTGSSRVLDAGSFASYQWQDGSTHRTFTARGTGRYAVLVTDGNGCRGGDTTMITTLLPVPKNFLPEDTAICSYGTLKLKPLQNFSAYTWNNNSTSAGITISQPGVYWLQATDANNCTGRDSIVVRDKECMKGLYVPTAFTPNGDGKNDRMQAYLFGDVKEFLFTIYDRWGQIVFQTQDPTKGWDGKIKEGEPATGAYVWTCRYRLEGEPEKFEKGTFMLIR